MNDFPTLLKEFLKSQGINGRTLSQKTGISHATISRWLHGQDSPKLSSLKRLALLGMNIEALLLPEVEVKIKRCVELIDNAGKKLKLTDEQVESLVDEIHERAKDVIWMSQQVIKETLFAGSPYIVWHKGFTITFNVDLKAADIYQVVARGMRK